MDAYLNQRQLAELAGVSSELLRLYKKAGKGPPFEVHGNQCLYPVGPAMDWVAERHANAAARLAARIEEAIASARRKEEAARNERLALEAQLARFTSAGESE